MKNDMIDLTRFYDFLLHHGGRIFASIVTGYFTFYAGNYYAGPLAGLVWVVLAEGMVLYWPFRLEAAREWHEGKKVDPAGMIQWISASVGILFSVLAIIATDLASAILIAQNTHVLTGALSQFAFTPAWVDKIDVFTLPILAFGHGLLLTIFYISSPEAAYEREVRAIERDANRVITRANALARKSQRQAEADRFAEIAANAATKKGKALAEERALREYGYEEADPTSRRPQ